MSIFRAIYAGVGGERGGVDKPSSLAFALWLALHPAKRTGYASKLPLRAELVQTPVSAGADGDRMSRRRRALRNPAPKVSERPERGIPERSPARIAAGFRGDAWGSRGCEVHRSVGSGPAWPDTHGL
jgi:hypothetical protein